MSSYGHPPPGGQPPPGYVPNPYFGHPGHPQFVPVGTYPTPGAPQAAPAPAAAPSTGWYMPDEQTIEQGYARAAEVAAEAARARQGGGGDMKFVKMPGPQGQTKWDATVPIGYESKVRIYLAPAWAPGVNYYIEGSTHFWKSYSHPNGTSIGCPGKDLCLIDEARGAMFKSGSEQDAERARKTLRPQKHFYYQGFLLDLGPNGHMSQTTPGLMKPFILDASGELHAKIQLIMRARGYQNVLHMDGGRPIILVKKKTGAEIQNVDWDALDDNPMPLPYEYRGAQLWDLSKLVAAATPQEQVQALQEVGLPIPPRAHSMIAQAGGYPGAPPAAPPTAPYGAPPAGHYPPPNGAYGAPPPNAGWAPGPGAPPWGPPPGPPPTAAPTYPVAPQYPAAPPAVPQHPAAPPNFGVPPQAPAPAMGAPPPPPPVTVPAGNPGSGYQPQPSQAGGYQQPPPPPPTMGPPAGPPAGPPPPTMGPPPGGMPPPPPTMAPPTGRPQ